MIVMGRTFSSGDTWGSRRSSARPSPSYDSSSKRDRRNCDTHATSTVHWLTSKWLPILYRKLVLPWSLIPIIWSLKHCCNLITVDNWQLKSETLRAKRNLKLQPQLWFVHPLLKFFVMCLTDWLGLCEVPLLCCWSHFNHKSHVV